MTQGQISAAFARGELTPAQAADLSMRNRGRSDRWQLVVAAVVAAVAVLLIVGCTTPPNPAPTGPGGAGGSAPPPGGWSCEDACRHREDVCSGGGVTCSNVCPGVSRVDPGYIPCVMASTGCSCCDSSCRAAAAKR